MSPTGTESQPAQVEPLPANIISVQPGGGVCYSLELAWGRVRRWYLRTFRRGYVARMAALRHGDPTGAPHEILDPRNLKYCRNLCTAAWSEADDPFAWRERIPFARWGLAELQLMCYPLLAGTVALAMTRYWPLAVPLVVVLGLIVYFFRDPPRQIPQEPGLMLSPADGKVVEILQLPHDEFIGGPAVRIGLFLSIFNVHLNRVPCDARVLSLRYSPGKFLQRTAARKRGENEAMWIGLEDTGPTRRRLVVRQIAGQFARRIVCGLRPGEELPARKAVWHD